MTKYSVNDLETRKFRETSHGHSVSVVSDGGFSIGGLLADYAACFVDEASSITYVSMEDGSGNWCVEKIDETSGTVITYATVNNNPTYTTVTTARTNRATLTYELPNLAFS